MRVIIHPLIFSYHDYSILKVIEHKPYDHNSQARFKIAVAVVNAVAGAAVAATAVVAMPIAA
jgi:hypothetical protein